VCTRRVRAFYHFTLTATTADAWRQQTSDGDDAVFELYWVPLVPCPRLIAEQAAWLESRHQALLRGTLLQ
jgi:hypothetical protein